MLARQTRRLNEEQHRQKDLLKQVDAEKTRFLVSSVHDFSQPLHAQGYFIHALRERLWEAVSRRFLADLVPWRREPRPAAAGRRQSGLAM